MIRFAIVAIYFFFALIFVGIPVILYARITGDADTLYRRGVGLVRGAMWLAGARLSVVGAENIPPGVCVFAANHTSNTDPPAAVMAIPRRVSLLAKKELFGLPIVGAALRIASLVPVDRSDRDAAVASVETAVAYLKSGVSFLVYPEGTRSPDGRLLPFKKGTFVMAIEAGVPVVPVAIAGAHRVMPKGVWTIHPGEIVVTFQPPVDAAAYTVERRGELLARVHAAVAAALPEDQRPRSSAKVDS